MPASGRRKRPFVALVAAAALPLCVPPAAASTPASTPHAPVLFAQVRVEERGSDRPVAQLIPGSSSIPSTLATARRLAEELRYEEAVVEYQRYLGLPDRPTAERAQAMSELAFVSLVLGDEVTARTRALEALELDPNLRPPPDAPRKWTEFLQKMQSEYRAQVRLELVSRADAEAPERVRAKLVDPRGRVKSVRLRHGLSPDGPYYASPMRCSGEQCEGDIPPPAGARAFTAYYFLEALDADLNTVSLAAGPRSPLRVSIIQKEPWYQSPWVWAGASAGIVAVGAVVFLASSPSR